MLLYLFAVENNAFSIDFSFNIDVTSDYRDVNLLQTQVYRAYFCYYVQFIVHSTIEVNIVRICGKWFELYYKIFFVDNIEHEINCLHIIICI